METHAEDVGISLPCNTAKAQQLSQQLSQTQLHPKRLRLTPADDQHYLQDLCHALAAPELAAVMSDVREVRAELPFSHALATVCGSCGKSPVQSLYLLLNLTSLGSSL
jgi:hypothetical protein